MNKNGNHHDLIGHKFYHAGQESSLYDDEVPCTPQTEHPTYRLAYLDSDFMLRDELRPVRFQLELLKPEMLLEEAGVGSTLVMYGSARIPAPEYAEQLVAEANEERRAVAERLAAKAKYYEQAYQLARKVSELAIVEHGKRQFVICSGGGPSIMEAANRGANDAGENARSALHP